MSNYGYDGYDQQTYPQHDGGYDMQNQGGYLPNSPSHHDGQTGTDSPQRKTSKTGNQTLTPVTIKQIQTAKHLHESIYSIDGKEMNHVTIVGVIVEHRLNESNQIFKIEDGTGTIDVRQWTEIPESDATSGKSMAPVKKDWTPFTYVRMIGNLKNYNNTPNFVALAVLPITDANEITYHLLECLYVHLYNQKSVGQQMMGGGGISAPITTTSSSSGQQHNPAFMNYNNQMANSQPQRMGAAIVNALRQAGHVGDGLSIQQLAQILGRTEADVRKEVEFLSGEGLIFSTVDENHWQVTDSS